MQRADPGALHRVPWHGVSTTFLGCLTFHNLLVDNELQLV
jgi:hypothetical protein